MEGRYLDIVTSFDAEFERNRRLHGDRIQCRAGCSSCCHQVFRIPPLEAARISRHLKALPESDRATLKARARAYQEQRALADQGQAPSPPCPALQDGICTIYQVRPIICHKFGMPIYQPDTPDRIFACELNFKSGEEIQDPDLIQIQTGLHDRWKALRAEYNEARPADGPAAYTIAQAILGSFPDS